jgi:ubiquinone/menaquinone biosynthesis C-methylase UbiE
MQEKTLAPGQPGGPTPERIMQLAFGFAPTQALVTALDLRLFTLVAEGKTTRADLEEATGASPRGLGRLLNVMVGLGFLAREGSGDKARYSLTPEADAFLVEGRPGYHGGLVRMHTPMMASRWLKLTECVRTGSPVVAADRPEEGIAVWDEVVDSLFPIYYPAAAEAGRELRRLHPEGTLRLLDVAAGSGVWSIAAAQNDPGIQGVALDLPEVLPHTRQWAERCGVVDRFEFRAVDIRQAELGDREFDAVLLGNVVHLEGAEHGRRLLAKSARALKPGGTLVLAEMLPDDDRSGPLFPLLFALNMLVHTTDGDTFTFSEYQSWLLEAGFKDVRQFEIPGPSPLILATRDGG